MGGRPWAHAAGAPGRRRQRVARAPGLPRPFQPPALRLKGARFAMGEVTPASVTRRDRDDPTGKAPPAQVLPVSPCLSLPAGVLGLWANGSQEQPIPWAETIRTDTGHRIAASPRLPKRGPLGGRAGGRSSPSRVRSGRRRRPRSLPPRAEAPSVHRRADGRGSSSVTWEGRRAPPGSGACQLSPFLRVHMISGVFQDFPSHRVSRGLGSLAEAQMGLDQPLRPSLPQTGHSRSQSPPPEV